MRLSSKPWLELKTPREDGEVSDAQSSVNRDATVPLTDFERAADAIHFSSRRVSAR